MARKIYFIGCAKILCIFLCKDVSLRAMSPLTPLKPYVLTQEESLVQEYVPCSFNSASSRSVPSRVLVLNQERERVNAERKRCCILSGVTAAVSGCFSGIGALLERIVESSR